MTSQLINLEIKIHDDVSEPDLELLTRQLAAEVSALDVESTDLAPGLEAPADAKGDPITFGSIVVALASAGAFTGLIEALKAWALRREGRVVTIKAKSGTQELELVFSPAETTPEEMEKFTNHILRRLQTGQNHSEAG